MEYNEETVDRYYDSLYTKYQEEATVPYTSYRDLEEKYEDFKREFEDFKQNIFYLAKEDKTGGIMEYLKSKGVF